MDLHHVGAWIEVQLPHLAKELGARDHGTPLADQANQNLELDRGELEFDSPEAPSAGLEIEQEVAVPQAMGRGLNPALEGANPSR